jgi:hypothetical protein
MMPLRNRCDFSMFGNQKLCLVDLYAKKYTFNKMLEYLLYYVKRYMLFFYA